MEQTLNNLLVKYKLERDHEKKIEEDKSRLCQTSTWINDSLKKPQCLLRINELADTFFLSDRYTFGKGASSEKKKQKNSGFDLSSRNIT